MARGKRKRKPTRPLKRPVRRVSATPARAARRKPVQTRVVRGKGGKWVLEKEYTPKGRFKAGAMRTKTGRATFVTVKPARGARAIVGCLPGDYSKAKGWCAGGTTIQKTVEDITARQAATLRREPGVKTVRKPLSPRAKVKTRKKRKATRRAANVPLMIVNPAVAAKMSRQTARAAAAYNRFHFVAPARATEVSVPDSWPGGLASLGRVLRLEVEGPGGRKVSRTYRGASKPVAATSGGMRKLYLMSSSRLGMPSGRALRIDYEVPTRSGRSKWARRWWHPHDSKPRITVSRCGRRAVVSGPKLKVTPRGIEG